MCRAIARGGLLALLATLILQATPAAAAPQPAAVVRSLTASLQKHRWPAQSFTSDTTLQIGQRRWRGSRAVAAWWQSQFRLGLKISLVSGVTTHGGRLEAVLQRSTRGGECAKTCWSRATWQFKGSRIRMMTLVPIVRPPAPSPPSTVPPPPTSGPPRGTPTIPS